MLSVLVVVLMVSAPALSPIEAAAKTLDYEVLNVPPSERRPYCQGEQERRSEAWPLLCQGVEQEDPVFLRSRQRPSDPSWTVQVDTMNLGDSARATATFEKLGRVARDWRSIVAADPQGKLAISWCPRAYLLSGSRIYAVSVACGAKKPFCASTRALWEALSKEGTDRPGQAIVGLEGGKGLVLGSPREFDRCEKDFAPRPSEGSPKPRADAGQ